MNQLNESVLMVEDDTALREALIDTLRSAGIAAVASGRCGGGPRRDRDGEHRPGHLRRADARTMRT